MISGIGVTSCFGVGRERFWHHVSRGVSGTRAITEFDVSTFPCQVAAPVPPRQHRHAHSRSPAKDADAWESRADPRRYSRAALLGVIAAREAWNDAGLRAGEPNAGVLIGSGGGGIDVGEAQYKDFFTQGGKHVTPYAIADRHRGDAVERAVDLARSARHQPRAVHRLHELDRRDRVRRLAAACRGCSTSCSRAAPTAASRRA